MGGLIQRGKEMKTSCSKLEQLSNGITKKKYYFDRIDLIVNDISSQDVVVKVLDGMNAKYKLTPIFRKSKFKKSAASSILIGYKLELIQPSKPLLSRIAHKLYRSHYTISWIEIAYDMQTKTIHDAIELFDIIKNMIVIKKLKKEPSKKFNSKRKNKSIIILLLPEFNS